MNEERFEVRAVGYVESPLTDLAAAPRQGDEGAPAARIRLLEEVCSAGHLGGGRAGGADVVAPGGRETLLVHPRGDESRPLTGVFSTRSADRPNPIGLHRVRVTGVGDGVIEVEGLEAVDGTPVVDIKPVIGGVEER